MQKPLNWQSAFISSKLLIENCWTLTDSLAAKTLPAIILGFLSRFSSAIQKPTTGDRQMKQLGKILYVADLIEPLRQNFTSVEEAKTYIYGQFSR